MKLQTSEFQKIFQIMFLEKKISYSTNVFGKTGYLYVEDWNQIPISHCQNTDSKWIKNLNLRLKTLKLLEENIGPTFQNVDIGNNISNRIPMALEIKARTDKWECIKLKIFWTAHETITRVKGQNERKSLLAICLIKD
jgi:hypothetical protein